MKGFVKITSTWEDSSQFEVGISATNGSFSGEAKCYTSREDIAQLAKNLSAFQRAIDSTIEFTTGEFEDLSFFTLTFNRMVGSEKVVVSVKICHNEYSIIETVENSFVDFTIPVKAAQIAKFIKSLTRLAEEKLGSVTAKLAAGK